MKTRVLRIANELFIHLFTKGVKNPYMVKQDAFPDDCMIIGVIHNPDGFIEVYLHSEEFESIEDGKPIPILDVVIENINTEKS